jgi:hypothetical protein
VIDTHFAMRVAIASRLGAVHTIDADLIPSTMTLGVSLVELWFALCGITLVVCLLIMATNRPCPYCRKYINRGAVICPYCRTNLRSKPIARDKLPDQEEIEVPASYLKQERLEREKHLEFQEAARIAREEGDAERRAERRAARDRAYRSKGIEPGPFAWYKAMPDLAQALILGLAFTVPAVIILIVIVRVLGQ